jgi:tRNA nucleotidyltransferase/poly(A) polymerase
MMNTPSPASMAEAATAVVRRLRDAGFEALWAGGCVRDRIMGRAAKDIDIATSARPDDVIGLFENTHAFGKAFGVVQVLHDDHPFEVATFRKDIGSRDGRHPDAVTFTSAEEDARRRDFTINGLFFDPIDGRIIDYVGGQDDIARRVVRTIGDAHDRFAEDYLRMLRAVRFSSTLQFELDADAQAAIRALAPRIAQVSAERIAQELTRLLTESPAAGDGVRLLERTGLLKEVLPEVTRMIGCQQPPEFHPEGDVFEHTLIMLNGMADPTPLLAWSVLLHDVGKPPTFQLAKEKDGSERIRFNDHDNVGAGIAEQILQRLRMPNELVEGVKHCVANHMRFIHVQEMRKATLRRLVGAPDFATELELHRLDCQSSHGMLDNYAFLKAFSEELKHEPVLPPRWITGADVMALGIKEGPDVGRWLKVAYDAQLEGRCPTRDDLLAWLRTEIGGGNSA